MKTAIRNILAALLLGPAITQVHLRSLFVGRGRAIALVGPALTGAAKRSLRYWVPRIERPEDFDRFAPIMKSRLRYWKLFYDVKIAEETADRFKIHVSHCPFYAVLTAAGLRELGPYLCEGDWAVARDNCDTWSFEREHQIGTGDAFCDHTYMRKKDQ